MGKSRRLTSSLLVLMTVVHTVEDRRGHVSREHQMVSDHMRLISSQTYSEDLSGRCLQFNLFIRDEHCCISLCGTSSARSGL